MNLTRRVKKLETENLLATITPEEIRHVYDRRKLKKLTPDERRARIEQLIAKYEGRQS